MNGIHFFWQDRSPLRRFRTGVSLHSHTLHSRESLDFLLRLRGGFQALDWIMRREERLRTAGRADYSCAWWRPPLPPQEAWEHERAQIEDGLGLSSLVSLTDHDNIDGSALLRTRRECKHAPVSVEWTVPVENSILHLGLHNLPPSEAPDLMRRMKAFSERRSKESLGDLLAELSAFPGVLVVLNHPLLDDRGIGSAAHRSLVRRFLERHRGSVHALELNGWRPWSQNRAVIEWSDAAGLPVVSGGDRHACEPATLLNLTSAGAFEEFVDEVRRGRKSHVLFLPPYREPRRLRIVETLGQILGYYPGHSMGWPKWSDRIFFRDASGATLSLTQAWGDRQPEALKRFVGLVRLLSGRQLRPALRFALAGKEEVFL